MSHDPRFSPVGTDIALAMRDDNGQVLALVDDQGTNVRFLTDGAVFSRVGAPAWAPDGNTIAFEAVPQGGRSSDSRIYTVALDGSGLQQVTDGPNGDSHPTWSPDGTRLAFSRWREGNGYSLYSLELESGEESSLTFDALDPFAADHSPSWSPDGTRLVFSSNRGKPKNEVSFREIYSLHLATGQVTQLTDNDFADSEPVWSPEGGRIAYTTYAHLERRESHGDPVNVEIYVMDANGSNQVRVTFNEHEDFNPSWSRDGRWLLFDSRRLNTTHRVAFLIEAPLSSSIRAVTWGRVKARF